MPTKLTHKTLQIAALAAAIIAVLTPATAEAITGGAPDGTGHPNVGALVADLPGMGRVPICTTTLISPTVALTAGHCTAALAARGIERVWVTFDPALDPTTWTLQAGAYVTDPAYGHDMGDLHDLAVVLLDTPVTGIAPATLPAVGLLDRLALKGGLRGQTVTNVGYGYNQRVVGSGPPQFLYDGLRRVSTSTFAALTPTWLRLLANGSEAGSGGVCYGDSGGPQFMTGSTTIIAVTSRGDTACVAMSAGYRLDTLSARAFLQPYVPLS